MENQLCLETRRRVQEIADEVARETAANAEVHREHERRIKQLEESGKRQSDILVTLQKQADAIESMNGKIDTFSDKVDSKIDSISEKVEQAVSHFDETDKRVAKLEKEPGEEYKKLKFEFVKYIVLAIAGAVVGYFFKGGI